MIVSLRRLLFVCAFQAAAELAFAAPVITSQPQPLSSTVAAGGDVIYTVAATGSGTLTYQWQKRTTGPFASITGATAATLTLANVQSSDSGTYRVVVNDASGTPTNSSSVTLTVNGAPVIVPATTFQNMAIALGSNASFTATVSTTGTTTYQWLKDGVEMTGQSATTLSFSPVSISDEGDYSLVATNSVGSVTSETARLWVVPPASQYAAANFMGSANFRLPYYYILPPNYDPTRRYPLWVFFHGASDTESTFLTNTGAAGFPRACISYARQAGDPAIAVYVTRQSGSSNWNGYAPVVAELIPWLQANLSIDEDRIYITGESAGGKPAVDVVTLSPEKYAGFMICDGTGDLATVANIAGVPLWAVWSQGDSVVTGTGAWVQAFRRAGGCAVYTQFVTPNHANSIMMGYMLPPAVEWLFAQRRGIRPTQDPQVSITLPVAEEVHKTNANAVSLGGTASAFGRPISSVSWENATTGSSGSATGTTSWSTDSIALATNQSSRLLATAILPTSWAPAYGGSTTFNGTILVTLPFDAVLATQNAANSQLSWTGGYPPYRVQTSADLKTWTDLNTNATSPLTVTQSGSRRFFRVQGR